MSGVPIALWHSRLPPAISSFVINIVDVLPLLGPSICLRCQVTSPGLRPGPTKSTVEQYNYHASVSCAIEYALHLLKLQGSLSVSWQRPSNFDMNRLLELIKYLHLLYVYNCARVGVLSVTLREMS